MTKLNILDFGAKVSDVLQTKQIQACIDRCFEMGGGEVIIPAGVFRTGGLRLRSNTTLHLLSGAILEASDIPEDYFEFLNDKVEPIQEYEPKTDIEKRVYPYNRWNNGVIRIIDAENVSIIGEVGSYIDGVNCYDEKGEEGYRGPHGINIQNSKNIHLEGYTIKNSANWAHAIFNSQNIVVKNIKVFGGHDGFDVRTCDNVHISDSEFICGDDSIAGYDNIDVTVENCIFNSSCNLIRFGGTHVRIRGCKNNGQSCFAHRYSMDKERQKAGKMTQEADRHNTLSVFDYYCDFRAQVREIPEDIIIEDCDFNEVDTLMCNLFERHMWCCNKPLKNITFKNCKVEGIVKPSVVYGSKDIPISLKFENCLFIAKEQENKIPFACVSYYDSIVFKNTKLSGFADTLLEVDDIRNIEADFEINVLKNEELIAENK